MSASTFAQPVNQQYGGPSYANAAAVTASATPFSAPAASLWINAAAASSLTLTLLDGKTSITISIGTAFTGILPIAATALTATTGTITVVTLS